MDLEPHEPNEIQHKSSSPNPYTCHVQTFTHKKQHDNYTLLYTIYLLLFSAPHCLYSITELGSDAKIDLEENSKLPTNSAQSTAGCAKLKITEKKVVFYMMMCLKSNSRI